MLNLTAMNVIADNEIAINGVVIGKLSDADAQKLIGIVKGFMSSSESATTATPSAPVKETKTRKIKVGYRIILWNNLYCICRGELVDGKVKHAGWTRAEKSAINAKIKALPEIVATRVKADREFTAWGYADEKTAIDMMATLPTEYEFEA